MVFSNQTELQFVSNALTLVKDAHLLKVYALNAMRLLIVIFLLEAAYVNKIILTLDQPNYVDNVIRLTV